MIDPRQFTIGQRVETHPGTNAWIMGDRYGTVTKIGTKWIHVAMDRSGRTLRFAPSRLLSVR